jgi:hypothetical protein
MSLKIRFRFDGRCAFHPRYNPVNDGRPQHTDCAGCESLYVVHLYTHIAQKKAKTGEGLVVRVMSGTVGENTADTIGGADSGSRRDQEVEDVE